MKEDLLNSKILEAYQQSAWTHNCFSCLEDLLPKCYSTKFQMWILNVEKDLLHSQILKEHTYQQTSWVHNFFSCLKDFETTLFVWNFPQKSINVWSLIKSCWLEKNFFFGQLFGPLIAFHVLKIFWPKWYSTKFQMWIMWKHINKLPEHIIAFHVLKIFWPNWYSTKFQMWIMWKKICYIPKW